MSPPLFLSVDLGGTKAAAAPVARAILEPLVHCPVALLNDARMATLGELEFGHGRQARGLALAAQVAGGR